MKDFRLKFLSLLNICADDHTETSKLLRLANVIQSEDYRVLENHSAFRKEYRSEWMPGQLESLSPEELAQKESEIHQLAKMLTLLQKAISSGNAPSLTRYDFSTFKNMHYVERLISKLTVNDGQKNYTNISSENMMKIFESSTIKSAKGCLRMLPLDVASKDVISEDDIRNAMGEKLYCIDIEELKTAHKQLLLFANNTEAAIKNEKERRRKHGLFKVAVIMTVILVCFACDQLHLFSEAFSNTFSVIMFVTSLLYLIGG